MRPDKAAGLRRDFPTIFPEGFHFECGDGWEQLLRDACNKLWLRDGPQDNLPTSSQVKEKFGGLRWYVDNATDTQYEIITEAENLSYKTCEFCGAYGTLRKGSWLKTLCDGCNETWQNRRK